MDGWMDWWLGGWVSGEVGGWMDLLYLRLVVKLADGAALLSSVSYVTICRHRFLSFVVVFPVFTT